MSDPETTGEKQDTRFKPGLSGNPAGRPKGSRNRLAEAFIADVYDDWKEHGAATLIKVRAEHPEQYLKVVASILPKELHVKDQALGELSDDELAGLLASVRSLMSANAGAGAGAGTEAPEGNDETIPTVPGHGTA